jgi:fructokinase
VSSGERVLIGLDLGGTKIEAAALRTRPGGQFETLARRRIPTHREEGYEAVLARTADLLRAFVREAGADVETAPIGVGMPGGLTRAGLIKNSNTVCLNGRPFRKDLCRELARDIAFDNDANCFALAEARMGAAAAYVGGLVFGVILGTGVGGGLVYRGEVWPGAQGIAGEWGHHAVWPDRGPVCYCGKRGCLEVFASGPAVERDYEGRSGARLTLAEIERARGDGDAHASAAIEALLDAFGRGLANVIDIVDPTAVVLGGGVSNLSVLYTEGAARVAGYVFNDELATPIVKNALGDSSGVLGAALLNA